MRLLILLLVGFFSLIAGLIATGALASALHLPDSITPLVGVGGSFVVATAALVATARWLERKDPPTPGPKLFGMTLYEPITAAAPAAASAETGDAAEATTPGERTRLDAVREELVRDRPPERSGWMMTALLGVMFAVSAGVDSVPEALALVGVLLVHELGHLVAMRAVGYRDVRIFFVPFFGAVTTARRVARPVAPWQRVLVSLAGPLPGLIAVFVVVLFGRPEGFTREVLSVALMVNLFNLLPLEQLDGGRVIADLLSSRSWRLEASFAVVSCLAIAALGASSSSWILCGLGVAGLTMLPRRKRVRAMVAELRSRWLAAAVPSPEELPDEALSSLVSSLDPILPPAARQPARYAAEIRALWELAAQPPASWPATLGLLSLYGVCCLGSLVTLVVWSLRQ